MPRIPGSVLDQRMAEALAKLTDEETGFLGMEKPVTAIKVRSLPAARNSQPYRNCRACAGNTNCIPICPIQAKYDPTISLNDATNMGAKLLDHAVASEVIVENGRVSQINYITYDNEAGPRTGEGCVKAKIYVIAANAIETPRLLLMSKNGGTTINGVANSSGLVGRHLMDHPYYVAWASLENALKLTDRLMATTRVVISGAGAAGVAVTRILLAAGITDIVVTDRLGVLASSRGPLNESKKAIAEATADVTGRAGTLADVMVGADVFIGVSGGTVPEEIVATMAPDAIVFGLANPHPEAPARSPRSPG